RRMQPRGAAASLTVGGRLLFLLVAGVAVEGTRRSELTVLVTHHVLGHEHRHELTAVVNGEGQAYGFREDGRATRPGLDRFASVVAASLFDLLCEVTVDERSFTDATCHVLLLAPALDDHAIGALVVTGLETLGQLAPG